MPYTVKKDVKTDTADKILRSGGAVTYEFSGDGLNKDDIHRLYFTCEDRIHYFFKDEPYGDKLYMLIDDSLSFDKAENDRFCLDLSEKCPRPFPKRAVKKVLWPVRIGIYTLKNHCQDWTLSIRAMAKDLRIEKGGYLRVRFERWNKKPGVPVNQTGAAPDETQFIDIPEGSYTYTELSKAIHIDDKTTACVLITVEGLLYSGKVCLETPALTTVRDGYTHNVLPTFDYIVPCRKPTYCYDHGWLGQNLSKKEWPTFKIELNGKVFFDGETFLRIHRYSPVELAIPAGLIKDKNTLTLTYTSHYHNTVPVAIRDIKILEKKRAPFYIHFSPDTAVCGKPIPLLIETAQDGMTLEFKSDIVSPADSLYFEKAGLHVIRLKQKGMTNNIEYTLSFKDYSETAVINKSVMREDDNVVVGSGDLIYIDNSDLEAVKDYIEWALANKTHSLITIRPAYRWGGHRTINPEVWKLVCEICNKMGIDYVNMSDGRDLPAIQCNPSPKMLEGEHYLGFQEHERDGQLFYWGVTPCEVHPTIETFLDITQRMSRESPDTTEASLRAGNIVMQRGILSQRKDIDCPADQRDAYQHALNSLKLVRGNYPRHTGPTIMYKYFYEAGFDWTGAETMDGSMEPQLAFLRGAANAFGKTRTGVHHAVQWSTYPHDTDERYRRFMLAHYISYIQGVTDINTEEGLWFLECQYDFNNRFSPACQNHVKEQQKIYKFITNHSRSGKYYTPVAFIHGRYDGWNGFGGVGSFGMPQLPYGDAESSWQLLHIYYPLCKISQSGCVNTGYIPHGSGKPFGQYSGNPNGNADAIPIENGKFSDYKALFFAGYNAAESRDLDRLFEYVQNGGILVTAWPHLSTTTDRESINSLKLNIIIHPLTQLFTDGLPIFEKDGGLDICINLSENAEVTQTTESGRPLVAKYKLGKGKIVLVNCLQYPGNAAAYPVYERVVTDISSTLYAAAPSNIICNDDVQYTQYRQEDGTMHFYVTPVDWYNDPKPVRTAMLRVGDMSHPLSLIFGSITKIVVKGDVAAWPDNDEFEILSVSDKSITVQGSGKCVINIVKKDKHVKKEIEIGADPVLTVEI